MAGIFDMFGGSSQSQGLLAAAAQILQASGPSRTPTSLGQILGGGLGAYQQQEQQARQLGQVEQLRGLQIKNAESDLAAQEAARQRAQNLLSLTTAYGKSRGDQQGASPMPAPRSADTMFRDLVSSGGMPAAAAAQQPSMTVAQAGPGGGGSRNALVQERLQYAQHLRDNGYAAEANAAEDQALKLQPKVKGWEKVQQNGSVMFAPFFEDGTSGMPVPLEVAEKLEKVNRGGTTDLVNSFTGATVRSLGNTASPDALLSAATQRRGQDITMRGQNMADARAAAAMPSNKPLPAGALKMQQTELDALATATGIDDQLARIQGQIDGGKLSFGPVSNFVNRGLNSAGMSTEGSRNLASFQSTLEKLRNDSLRLNAGVQTDGDAQRAWNELFQNINDTDLVKQRLGEIRNINQRGAQLRKLNVDGIRANYGHNPLDTSSYERPSAPAAPATGGGWSIRKVD